jgi:hypothetical protein
LINDEWNGTSAEITDVEKRQELIPHSPFLLYTPFIRIAEHFQPERNLQPLHLTQQSMTLPRHKNPASIISEIGRGER